MKWVLFFFCCTGLAYCLLMIVYNVASMLYMYRELKFLSRSFNSQYKVLRKFIPLEMTDAQIYEKLENHPDELNEIFVDKSLYIFFEKNAGIICRDTAKVREYLMKAACMICTIKDAFEKRNIIFYQGIYDENDEFFKELQKICETKGEPTYYGNVSIEEEKEEFDEYDD